MTRRHGRAQRGQRLVAKAPYGRWRTLTFLAALRVDRIDAPLVLDGPINGRAFTAYVEQFLVPTLAPGDIVIMDNLGSHKGKAVIPATWPVGTPIPIKADAAWLECESVCIPSYASFAFMIPTSRETVLSNDAAPMFAAARSTLPMPTNWRAAARKFNNQADLVGIAIIGNVADFETARNRPLNRPGMHTIRKRPIDRGFLAAITGFSPIGVPVTTNFLMKEQPNRVAGGHAFRVGNQAGDHIGSDG